MSPDVLKTPATTISLNSSENPTQSSVVPVSPKVLPTAALVQAANDNMKLHLSVRGGVKVMNLTHSMEFSKPKVVSARLVSEPTVSLRQPVPKSNQQKSNMPPKGLKEGCWICASLRTLKSSTKFESLKCPDHCNRIRAKPKLVLCPKRSALMDNKCNELQWKISKVVVQNAGEAASSYHRGLMFSQTKFPCPHIELSLARPIQGTFS
ncbi:hypothetical protein ACTXT7_010509 [Hymenolepis weldensis]